MSLFAELTASVNAVRPAAHAQLRPAVGDRGVDLAAAWPVDGVFGVDRAGRRPRYASYGRYYFVIRHGAFISAGLLAAAVTLTIPIRVWQRLAVPLFVLAMILLVAVLIPASAARSTAPTAGFRWVR